MCIRDSYRNGSKLLFIAWNSIKILYLLGTKATYNPLLTVEILLFPFFSFSTLFFLNKSFPQIDNVCLKPLFLVAIKRTHQRFQRITKLLFISFHDLLTWLWCFWHSLTACSSSASDFTFLHMESTSFMLWKEDKQ